MDVREYRPVMEARHVSELDILVPYRDKVYLPTDSSSMKKNQGIFFLNTSIDGITKILRDEHPKVSNRANSYRTYYYDAKFLRIESENLLTAPKKSVMEYKDERKTRYTEIGNKFPSIITPISPTRLMGYNVIYDMQPMIEELRRNKNLVKKPLIAKLNTFFKCIADMVIFAKQHMGAKYTIDTIFVDLDEWSQNKEVNDFHILTMLLAVLRKPRVLDSVKAYSDYQILFYTKDGYFVFDTKRNMDRVSRIKLINYVRRINPNVDPDTVVSAIAAEEVANRLTTAMGFAGEVEEDEGPIISELDTVEEPQSPIDPDSEPVKKVANSISDVEDVDDALDAVVSDIGDQKAEELKKEIANTIIDSNRGRHSVASTKRDALLREKQKEIMIRDKTIKELTKEVDIPKVTKKKIKNPQTINEGMTEVSFANFDRDYNEQLMDVDIANAFTMFNGATVDMNIVSVDVADTSDKMNLKNTYTVVYEDEYRRRHTIKVDIPIVFNDSFVYINGNTKLIENQITGLPVIKTDPDTVRINTDYNKITITRKGHKLNPNTERFKKLVENPDSKWSFSRGNNVTTNKGQLTCLEYDELAVRYNRVNIGNYHFVFNVELLMEETGHKYKSTLDKILIGYKKSNGKIEPIYYDRSDPDHPDMVTMIIQLADSAYYEEFKAGSFGKKYMYTMTTIMTKDIPTVVLICFFEGLTKVIKKFNDPNVKFVDKKTDKNNYMYIQFKDGYLEYPMSDMEACIMFNGLNSFTTKNYTIAELDNRQTYIDILIEVCKDGYVSGALINFYDFMISPFTKQLLELYNLPTDLVSLIIYANNLLVDNQYTTDISMTNYRLRRNEIIPAILYKQLSIGYSRYRTTANNANPAKMRIDQSCVIKEIQALPTCQDYNYSGPMTEVKMRSLASMKGYVGMNNDRAYKMDKRVYDKSMIGIIGMSTDNAKNCGKERHLVLEPNVINARGMVEITDGKDVDKLEMQQLETGIELLNPLGPMHDDPVRVAMATKQRGSAIPVKDQCPMLISTGMDSTIQYRTCDDYSVVAKMDGEVVDVNNNLKLITVKYKDGSTRCIDLAPKMAKNGGAGMYLKKELTSKLKKGDKFKQDDILAWDPMFFSDNEFMGNRLVQGTLIHTAIAGNGATYEDSMFCTYQMSRRMASEITMCKMIIVGKTANLDHIVKRGDPIKLGDELIRFETAYDDAELNRLLAGIRDDLHEEIVNLGKTKIIAKYEGWIDDVVCYPTISTEEMSPTLAKVVKQCQKFDKDREAYLNKVDPKHAKTPLKAGCLMTKPTDIVAPDVYGKIDGEDVTDAVMFKIYITYLDEMSDGDKVVHQTANKGTIGDMIPLGYEPRTEFRPYEEISTFQAPSAILARGTPSIEPSMLHYKGLIELKRKQYEILTGESWNDKAKRDNPYLDNMGGQTSVTETMEAFADYKMSLRTLRQLKLSFNLEYVDEGFVSPISFNKGDLILCGFNNTAVMDGLEFDAIVSKFQRGTHDDYNACTDYFTSQVIAAKPIGANEQIKLLR